MNLSAVPPGQQTCLKQYTGGDSFEQLKLEVVSCERIDVHAGE